MSSLSNLVPKVGLRFAVVAAGALSVASAGAEEPTVADLEVDPSAKPPEGTARRLLWTGAALTAGWYAASVGSSFYWQDAPASNQWLIPVAGPWMALDKVRCGPNEASCGDVQLVIRTAITLLSSVGQLGGLLAMSEGLLLDSSPGSKAGAATAIGGAPVRPSAARDSSSSIQWLALPSANPNGIGLEILGRF